MSAIRVSFRIENFPLVPKLHFGTHLSSPFDGVRVAFAPGAWGHPAGGNGIAGTSAFRNWSCGTRGTLWSAGRGRSAGPRWPGDYREGGQFSPLAGGKNRAVPEQFKAVPEQFSPVPARFRAVPAQFRLVPPQFRAVLEQFNLVTRRFRLVPWRFGPVLEQFRAAEKRCNAGK